MSRIILSTDVEVPSPFELVRRDMRQGLASLMAEEMSRTAELERMLRFRQVNGLPITIQGPEITCPVSWEGFPK